MSKKPTPIEEDIYWRQIYWILRHKGGGKRPPEEISQVVGWKLTRMIADTLNREPRTVARDLIEHHQHMENGFDEPPEQWP